MSRQAQADIILRLYEIRGGENLRAARTWFMTDFNPQSAKEIAKLMGSGHGQSANFRMVTTYWDMACAFVVFEAIDEKFFHATQTEYLVVFAKIEPFMAELKEIFGMPDYLGNLERIARSAPNADEYFGKFRGLMKSWNEAENNTEPTEETL